MQVKRVENTKSLPSRAHMVCVQATTEADALRELNAIAVRDGITLAETVYAYGTYYYAEFAFNGAEHARA